MFHAITATKYKKWTRPSVDIQATDSKVAVDVLSWHAEVKKNDQVDDRLVSIATITSGLNLRKTDVLRSLLLPAGINDKAKDITSLISP